MAFIGAGRRCNALYNAQQITDDYIVALQKHDGKSYGQALFMYEINDFFNESSIVPAIAIYEEETGYCVDIYDLSKTNICITDLDLSEYGFVRKGISLWEMRGMNENVIYK